MDLWSDSYVRRVSYKEFTCIYGGIDIVYSDMFMEGFIYRQEFISGVHMYLWQDSYLGRDSYKEFKRSSGGIHI